jgi:hypothetical protein
MGKTCLFAPCGNWTTIPPLYNEPIAKTAHIYNSNDSPKTGEAAEAAGGDHTRKRRLQLALFTAVGLFFFVLGGGGCFLPAPRLFLFFILLPLRNDVEVSLIFL